MKVKPKMVKNCYQSYNSLGRMRSSGDTSHQVATNKKDVYIQEVFDVIGYLETFKMLGAFELIVWTLPL
jgi:hypothetical protein